jgi:hypothetical protein
MKGDCVEDQEATASPGVATITKVTKTAQGNTLVSDPVQEEVFAAKPVVIPCSVGVNAARTFNLGNYESVKIGVHLSVTVEPEDIEPAFEQVSEWVSDKLSSLAESAGLGG